MYDYKKIYENMLKPAFIFDGRMILDHRHLVELGYHVTSIGRHVKGNKKHNRHGAHTSTIWLAGTAVCLYDWSLLVFISSFYQLHSLVVLSLYRVLTPLIYTCHEVNCIAATLFRCQHCSSVVHYFILHGLKSYFTLYCFSIILHFEMHHVFSEFQCCKL